MAKEDQTVEGSDGNSVASSDDKLWALFSHLGGLFVSFVPPLVIWLVKKDENEFVEDQSKEALNFQITVLLASFVCGALTCIGIGLILVPIVAIADLVFCIVAAVKSYGGERYRYPATLRLIK